ncbi:hypothetical protein JXM67_07625 [candidate division WOR-3 bacterium]|nr:hypothetical protein [candidate division WOR-3 bacterium]
MRKTILAVVALLLLIAATPVSAQIAGTWEGKGLGSCYPHPGTIIYPWQKWTGEIPNSQDVFKGDWWDQLGNKGIFKGEIDWVSITVAICKGSWYWYDPAGVSAKPVYGGDFKMTFYVFAGDCNGEWYTDWPSPGVVGTMKGYKVP